MYFPLLFLFFLAFFLVLFVLVVVKRTVLLFNSYKRSGVWYLLVVKRLHIYLSTVCPSVYHVEAYQSKK